MTKPRISIIVAHAANRVIGFDGNLPWRISDDLKRFRAITMGHTVIMGRKTYESIGHALPGRQNIVMTRKKKYAAKKNIELAGSLNTAIKKSVRSDVFIIGGGEIYKQALPIADRLFITLIDDEFKGDAYFPEISDGNWESTFDESHITDDGLGYCFLDYVRRTL